MPGRPRKPQISIAWGRVVIMIGSIGVSLTPEQSSEVRRQLLECERALLGMATEDAISGSE